MRSSMSLGLLTTLLLSGTAALADTLQDCKSLDPARARAACTQLLDAPDIQKPDQFVALRGRATALLRQNQLALAEVDLRRALEIEPNNTSTLAALAESLRRREKYDEALEQLKAALASSPNSVYALTERAAVFVATGDLARAEQDLDRVLALEPSNVFMLVIRGKLFRLKGNLDVSLDNLNQAVAISPKNVFALQERAGTLHLKRDYAKAIADYTAILTLQPTHPTAASRRQAATALLESQSSGAQAAPGPAAAAPAGAAKTTTVANAQATTDAEIKQMLERAAALAKQGQLDEAIKTATRVVELRPAVANGYVARGIYLYLKHDRVGATRDFGHAVRLDGTIATPYIYLATMMLEAGKPAEALTQADHVVRLTPNDFSGYNLRGLAHHSARRYDMALESFTAAANLVNAPGHIFENRANSHLALKNVSAAMDDLQTALRINSRSTRALTIRGNVMLVGGRFDAATADFKQVLSLNPSDFSAKLGLQTLLIGKSLSQFDGEKSRR